MKQMLFGTLIAFIGICGFNYLCGCVGLSIHNHLLSMALSAFAGCGSIMLAVKI